MEDRRIKLRRHIQAARAWLLQADKSLEHRNDVQGDLKLMLAKAELAQTKTSYFSLMKKILPPVTALLIAGAFFFNDEPPAPTIETQPPSIEISEPTSENSMSMLDLPSNVLPDAVVSMPSADAPREVPSEISIDDPIAEPIDEPIEIQLEPAFEEPIEETYAETYAPTYEPIVEEYRETEYHEPIAPSLLEEEAYVSEVAVPNEAMQQLMSDAGQILRAK